MRSPTWGATFWGERFAPMTRSMVTSARKAQVTKRNGSAHREGNRPVAAGVARRPVGLGAEHSRRRGPGPNA